ncbi:hypothetical protein NE237_014263 [Protea cynaroides]|uniref:Uncharacterized protein n=1 Tax=Protea cynaroides TaxID=273540 RepID=A0A9Q0GN16_9MAGN|nr:hypothetical protein NE237_014263 [Protea cynaroides]
MRRNRRRRIHGDRSRWINNKGQRRNQGLQSDLVLVHRRLPQEENFRRQLRIFTVPVHLHSKMCWGYPCKFMGRALELFFSEDQDKLISNLKIVQDYLHSLDSQRQVSNTANTREDSSEDPTTTL